MPDLQSLMQAAQRAGVDPGQLQGAMGGGGGGGGGGMPPGGGGAPPMPMGGGMPPGAGGMPPGSEGGDMAQQLMQLVGKVMSTPKGMQMAQALMQAVQGGMGGAMPPLGTVMAQDPQGQFAGQMPDMLNASDAMRRDLPPAQRDGYTGGEEMDEPRKESDYYKGGSNANRRKLSTEEELSDIQKKMGGKKKYDMKNDGDEDD